jgi:sortase B
MFRDLENYQEREFYEEHREFEFQTLHGTLRYRIFSAYLTTTEFLFIKTRFDDTSYLDFLSEIQARNLHPSSQTTDPVSEPILDADSKILTLATCSRAFEDARFVVHAVLISPSKNP